MVKQQKHLRKIKNKLFVAGKGNIDSLIGKLVWYNKNIYIVVKKNKDNTYNIKNLTAKLMVQNVPRFKLRLYK